MGDNYMKLYDKFVELVDDHITEVAATNTCYIALASPNFRTVKMGFGYAKKETLLLMLEYIQREIKETM